MKIQKEEDYLTWLDILYIVIVVAYNATQIVLIILKLCHVLDVSWWIVTIPLDIELVVYLMMAISAIIVMKIIEHNE